ncbi:hypothetical protein FB451DRAFT_1413470 [Mycena latifolia]|nr:hypothetical protein FB451DRAFT_1413470 [Mycena latifolia]
MVEIPQELIDVIIREILSAEDNPFRLYHPESAVLVQALRAGSFFQRSLPEESNFEDIPSISEQLSKLLLRSPHISSYVRHLHIVYSLADAEPLAAILSSLPNLEEVDFYPNGYDNASWNAHPVPLKASYLAALSRPTVRRVGMVHHKFTHASELHTLLENTVGLKDLTMRYIGFSNTEIPSAESVPRTPTVVLDSLGLRSLDPAEVESMMQAFTSVDITHLRSLDLMDTAAISLLRANASTLQKVAILADSRKHLDVHDPEQDILAAADQLASIELRVSDSHLMNDMLRSFGNLAHLTALRMLSLEIFKNIYPSDKVFWRHADSALSSLQLDAVEVKATKHKPKGRRTLILTEEAVNPQEVLMEWMPALVQKGILRIFS